MSRWASWLFGSDEPESETLDPHAVVSLRYDDVSSSDEEEGQSTPPSPPENPPVDTSEESSIGGLFSLFSRIADSTTTHLASLTSLAAGQLSSFFSERDEYTLEALVDLRLELPSDSLTSEELPSLEDLFSNMLGRSKIDFLTTLALECDKAIENEVEVAPDSLSASTVWNEDLFFFQRMLGSESAPMPEGLTEETMQAKCGGFDALGHSFRDTTQTGQQIFQIIRNGLHTASTLCSTFSLDDNTPVLSQSRFALDSGVIKRAEVLGRWWLVMIVALVSSGFAHWSLLMTNETMKLLIPASFNFGSVDVVSGSEEENENAVTDQLRMHVLVEGADPIANVVEGCFAFVVDQLDQIRIGFSTTIKDVSAKCQAGMGDGEGMEEMREELVERTIQGCSELLEAQKFAREELRKVLEGFHKVLRYSVLQFGS